MKKLVTLLAGAVAALALHAIPADPTPVRVGQPGGDSLTLKLVGDEFYHYNATTDGYTVLHTGAGWEYACLTGGRLAPTGVLAHDAGRRTAAEQSLLATLARHVTDRAAVQTGMLARRARDTRNQRPNRAAVVDYSKFRGLIVLINFTDKKFLMNDPNGFYSDMVNTKDYEGYYTGTGATARLNRCTGSMRDYFYDQSMGQFDPQFDVVGPVEVPFSCRECGENYSTIFRAALDSIDAQVDFTQYDSDSDHGIDMVFFMVAGYSASYSGNSQEYLWPHMSYLYGYDAEHDRWEFLTYDGMAMGRYASSTEIYGWESYGQTGPAGIGTMCHEFSHVLGLPDLYDTDYEDGGGQSNHPGDWDVMAGGSHVDQGRTPVGYSLWERSELGWAIPGKLDVEGQYTLTDISKSNEGFIMQSPVEGEIFYFENRQNTKWDRALPGHGLLVARVDRTNRRIWDWNRVNADPSHNYYELIRSAFSEQNTTYPGPTGANELNAISNPPLATWNGTVCPLGLTNIAETDGVITFDLGSLGELNSVVEDFEAMDTTVDVKVTGVQGNFAVWDFVQANVANDEHFASARECKMAMPSTMTMVSDFDADVYQITLDAYNPSSQDAKFQLSYSFDKGATWKSLGNSVTVPGLETSQLSWRPKFRQPFRLRLTRNGGNKNLPVYIDNLTINFIGEQRVAEGVKGDVDGNGVVDVDDLNIIINVMLRKATLAQWPQADADGSGEVDIDDLNIVINIMVHKD